MKKKKVLFVATVVKIHIMVFHIPYLKWFKENGYEVHVAARNDYENKEDCHIPFCDKFYDIPFERSPFKMNNVNIQRELKEVIENNEYEIVHCHTPMGGVLGRLAAREVRKNGTRVIYTAHGFHFFEGAPFLNWLIYYPIERWLARYTDVLITINTEDYMRAREFPADRVEYLPGVGIDLNKFSQVEINKASKRKELGLPTNTFILLSVGELNKNKNHEVVIRALSKTKDTNLHYAICGKGALENKLKKLSKELGVEDQVHFLGFKKDILEVLKAVDLFVFPSFREGLSVSLMEAMASGVPVICSDIRGNSDLIEDRKGGLLINPDDEKMILTAIENIKESETMRKTFVDYNKEKIEKYSIDSILSKLNNIYFKPADKESSIVRRT